MDLSVLKGITLVEAGWLRYLMGIDDAGTEMAISPDPRLEEMKTRLCGVCFGDNSKADDVLPGILSDESIFGVDLMKIGLGANIIAAFKRMNSGEGQVRLAISEIE